MPNFIISLLPAFYLVKLPVVFLNVGLIFHPDFHPETLLLTDLARTCPSLGVGVALTVLHFPGLNKWRKKWFCSDSELRTHLPFLNERLEGCQSEGCLETEETKEDKVHVGLECILGGSSLI